MSAEEMVVWLQTILDEEFPKAALAVYSSEEPAPQGKWKGFAFAITSDTILGLQASTGPPTSDENKLQRENEVVIWSLPRDRIQGVHSTVVTVSSAGESTRLKEARVTIQLAQDLGNFGRAITLPRTDVDYWGDKKAAFEAARAFARALESPMPPEVRGIV